MVHAYLYRCMKTKRRLTYFKIEKSFVHSPEKIHRNDKWEFRVHI